MKGRSMSSSKLSPKKRALVICTSAAVSVCALALGWMYLPQGYFVLTLVTVLVLGMALEALGVLR